MVRIIKRNLVICILLVLLIDGAIGCLLFKSRSFSHLAIWNIIESNKKDDFYWPPEDVPKYFHFEPDSDRLSIFKDEIFPLVKNESDEFKVTLVVAKYVMDISSDNIRSNLSLKWDSPEEILKQIREGAGSNCFHRSILFSTYLSSLGVKARLWALENKRFNAAAHSVSEVYIKGLKKWVFADVMFGFYVSENGIPLSFLELREKLLDGRTETILVHNIRDESKKQKEMPASYRRLIKCVFLRADNDFVNKYNSRYGGFSVVQRYIDKLPDDIRRGLGYWLGRQDVFIHYIDRYSRNLKPMAVTVRLIFYFFIFSLGSMGILLVMCFLSFLKRHLAASLSKKNTRHK